MLKLAYQTAFHLASIGLVLSRERVIEDCNEQLCAIFRQTRGSLIGRSLDRLAPHGTGVWTFEELSETRRVAIELTPREREIAA
ncbi:hypothetical protein B0O95_11370 [Mycetohabitans endofungorum]|uniref:PAS domain-containing protein n=1 Tax=Mycetohabitans endofungorum TaxID=417203 RepID=A0A2P5K7V0_9BURK|nr:hypothetical protein B0O95_11370 [Mycetohabitans endofungorum]